LEGQGRNLRVSPGVGKKGRREIVGGGLAHELVELLLTQRIQERVHITLVKLMLELDDLPEIILLDRLETFLGRYLLHKIILRVF
jgi:hypothetical protein